MELCSEHRGEDIDFERLEISLGDSESSRVMLRAKFPLGEIVMDFFDKLKGRSSGFASFE